MTLAYSYLRMSTEQQLQGDSLRRQLDLSRTYAESHELTLIEDYQDIGVSAFKGKQRSHALGDFLNAVEDGRIPKGSYLLIEALDRLSREAVNTALGLFQQITSAGIHIVTLQDNQVFMADSLNAQDLIISIIRMERSHEESVAKSKRLKASWLSKRQQLQETGKKLTGKCPTWLELDNKTNTFSILKAKAQIVSSIFERYLKGIGPTAIARQLNQQNVPNLGEGKKGWHPNTITQLLQSEAVIGTYHPKSIDEPIKNYFPSIITPAVFLKAQDIQQQGYTPRGNSRPGGHKNLFTSLAICGYCGSTMYYDNKGHGYSYLVCTGSRRGYKGCKRHSWKYDQVQSNVLVNLVNLDYSQLFPKIYKTQQAKLNDIQTRILMAQDSLQRVTNSIKKVMDILISMPDSEALRDKLRDLETQRDDLRLTIATLKESKRKAEKTSTTPEHYKESLTMFIQKDSDPEVRGRLWRLLKATLDRIILHPPSSRPAVNLGFIMSDGKRVELDEGYHGSIELVFKDVKYRRLMEVSGDQMSSLTYRIEENGTLTEQFSIPLLDWPPSFAFMSKDGKSFVGD